MGTPALPFCHVTLTADRPRPYLKELKTLGDHIRKKRLELGLLQKDVARQLGVKLRVDTTTVRNWENNRTAPDLRIIPRLIQFLGYTPYPPAITFEERLEVSRRARGLSQRELATILGVDESTLREWEKRRRKPSGGKLDVAVDFVNETHQWRI